MVNVGAEATKASPYGPRPAAKDTPNAQPAAASGAKAKKFEPTTQAIELWLAPAASNHGFKAGMMPRHVEACLKALASSKGAALRRIGATDVLLLACKDPAVAAGLRVSSTLASALRQITHTAAY